MSLSRDNYHEERETKTLIADAIVRESGASKYSYWQYSGAVPIGCRADITLPR